MDKYQEMRLQSLKKAEEMVEAILYASQDPTRQISGETLTVYKEFCDWGWFDEYPLSEIENLSILKRIIAMNHYKQLKFNFEHPPKEKPRTKWEHVMGRVR